MLLLATMAALAGTEATTADGKLVLLNDDGTWAYKAASPPVAAAVAPPIATDCATLIETTEDRVSGAKYTGTRERMILSDDGKEGLAMHLMVSDEGLIWSIVAVGASGCIDDDATTNLLFRDGTRMALENDVDFNCKGRFTTYYGGVFGKRAELEALATKEIEVIRVWTHDGSVERTLRPNDASRLRASFACLKR